MNFTNEQNLPVVQVEMRDGDPYCSNLDFGWPHRGGTGPSARITMQRVWLPIEHAYCADASGNESTLDPNFIHTDNYAVWGEVLLVVNRDENSVYLESTPESVCVPIIDGWDGLLGNDVAIAPQMPNPQPSPFTTIITALRDGKIDAKTALQQLRKINVLPTPVNDKLLAEEILQNNLSVQESIDLIQRSAKGCP